MPTDELAGGQLELMLLAAVGRLDAAHGYALIAALREASGGRFDLVVLGTSLRQGETKFLGSRMASLLRRIRTPALVIAR